LHFINKPSGVEDIIGSGRELRRLFRIPFARRIARKGSDSLLCFLFKKDDLIMSPSFFKARNGQFAAAVFTLSAAAIAACSAPSPVGPSVPSSSVGLGGAATYNPNEPKVNRDSTASPTPFPFQFATINDPESSTFNRASAINELGRIVGYYGSGSPSDPSHGYLSAPPYTKFRTQNYPGAVNTVMTTMSTDHLRAGYFLDSRNDTWGFVEDRGIWTLYKDLKAKGLGFVDEILGINGSNIAVGFYTDTYGDDQPYELVVTQNEYTILKPPGAKSAIATGINLRGDISGTETLANGQTEGWKLRGGVYTQLSYPGSTSTQALGLDFEEDVVGSYVDSAGATHGFVLTNPDGHQYWQSVDEPNAAGTTVINCINSKHAIVGWYVDAHGNTNGFMATVGSGS
jgi:hypothetical protein